MNTETHTEIGGVVLPELDTTSWKDVNTMSVDELRAELTAARAQLIQMDKACHTFHQMLRASAARLTQLVCNTRLFEAVPFFITNGKHIHTHQHSKTRWKLKKSAQ